MILETSSNHYEVLEVPPDATQQEIRQAYLRLKLAYSKDSVALYTLVSKDEMDDILIRIEAAYQILSNDEKRREYDRNHNQIGESDSPFGGGAPVRARPKDEKIQSIDRVPPMDKLSREEDLLVAPSTDFSNAPVQNMGQNMGQNMSPNINQNTNPTSTSTPIETLGSGPAKPPVIQEQPRIAPTPVSDVTQLLQEEIEKEEEFPGHFLKKIREARQISIEEMSDYTKVSKTYIVAIESENFPKLPAATFVRGFVAQIAKKLKLPYDKVAAAYVSRYRRACPDKS